MSQPQARKFEDKPGVREKVPILIGLAGPSGGGKTYSALRLATGMQRVSGGEVWIVDTEAKRSLHYADRFKFRHVEFGAPFSPLDYLAAIQHCYSKGAGIIIVDSMSHEHEGPGGVLEYHQAEMERLAKAWKCAEAKTQMAAWSRPKADRRRLLNSILQIPCNFIFCFRAKDKIKIVSGKDPQKLGFMPIAGEEFVYEMTANALLLPNAGGVPTWRSDEIGERLMIKLPEQFREIFAKPVQLSEDIGEQLARWAAGDTPGKPTTTTAAKANGKKRDKPYTLPELIEELEKKKDAPPTDGAVLLTRVTWLAGELGRLLPAFSRTDLDEYIAQQAIGPDAAAWEPDQLDATSAATGWAAVLDYIRAEAAVGTRKDEPTGEKVEAADGTLFGDGGQKMPD